MKEIKWLGLQFFAGEGTAAADGSSEGAAPGVEAAAPGQEKTLADLGVPLSMAAKYGERMRREEPAKATPAAEAEKETGETREAASPEAETKEAKPRQTLAELVKGDQELNRELQGMIQNRVKGFAQARDTLKELRPALALIARQYGLASDGERELDLKALAKAVTEDDRFWEAKAEEYGVTPDLARKIEGYEELRQVEEQRERDELQEQQFRAHVGKLVRQAEALKQTIPDFDLKRELSDEKFRRFTSPEIGMSVKDAYYALHYDELRQAESALIAQRAEREIANKIAAGQARPREGGGRAPSVGGLARTSWTPADIERIKREAMAATARGEKYYIE